MSSELIQTNTTSCITLKHVRCNGAGIPGSTSSEVKSGFPPSPCACLPSGRRRFTAGGTLSWRTHLLHTSPLSHPRQLCATSSQARTSSSSGGISIPWPLTRATSSSSAYWRDRAGWFSPTPREMYGGQRRYPETVAMVLLRSGIAAETSPGLNVDCARHTVDVLKILSLSRAMVVLRHSQQCLDASSSLPAGRPRPCLARVLLERCRQDCSLACLVAPLTCLLLRPRSFCSRGRWSF